MTKQITESSKQNKFKIKQLHVFCGAFDEKFQNKSHKNPESSSMISIINSSTLIQMLRVLVIRKHQD